VFDADGEASLGTVLTATGTDTDPGLTNLMGDVVAADVADVDADADAADDDDDDDDDDDANRDGTTYNSTSIFLSTPAHTRW
jgi:hypothetical protein